MIARITLLLSLSLVINTGLGAQNLLWEEVYGSKYIDQYKTVVPVDGEHQVILGHMHRDVKFYPGPTKLVLLKVDTAGKQQWIKNFNFDGLIRAGDLLKTPDGGFLITATLRKPDQTHHLVWKLNKNGKPVWKNRGTWKTGVDPMLIANSRKGGYFLIGAAQTRHSYRDSKYKGVLVRRIDHKGNEQFQNTLGYRDILEPVSFGRINEQHYYIIARNQAGRPILMKGESLDGQFLADFIKPVELNLGNYHSISLKDACRTANGHFLLAGSGLEDPPRKAPMPNAWLCQLDGQGDRIWNKVYNKASAQAALAVMPLPGSGFVIGGYQGTELTTNDPEDREAWLARTTLKGRRLWKKTYERKDPDQIHILSRIPNTAEYLALGKTHIKVRKDQRHQNAWLAKFDTTGFHQPEPVKMTGRKSLEETDVSLEQLIGKMQTKSTDRGLNQLLYRYRLIADPADLRSGSSGEASWPFHTGQLSIDTFRKNLFGDRKPETVLQLREAGHYVINVFYYEGQGWQKVPGRISNHFSDRHLSTDFVFYFENIAKPNTYEIATKKSWQYNRSDNEKVSFYDIVRDTLRQFYQVATKSFSYSGLRTYLHDTKRSLKWQQKQGYPKHLVVKEEAEHEEDMKRKPSGGKVVSGRTTKASIRRVIHFETTPMGLKLTRINEDISRTINIINPSGTNN